MESDLGTIELGLVPFALFVIILVSLYKEKFRLTGIALVLLILYAAAMYWAT